MGKIGCTVWVREEIVVLILLWLCIPSSISVTSAQLSTPLTHTWPLFLPWVEHPRVSGERAKGKPSHGLPLQTQAPPDVQR